MINSIKNIVLETENLTVGYQTKKQQTIIVPDINLSIEKGKFVALLGKNGIGKSTLLRTISNVQKPLKGNIKINKKNISEYSHQELATSLSLVLTEKLPESQLTVFELIALGRQPYTNWIDKLSAKDIQKINWAIHQTDIEHLKEKRFYELSDGQLQRVLIARALAQDTDLIILDEPTAHLDIHHTFKVFSLLKKLVEKTGKTIIISTHEVNIAIQLADEFILLTDSQIYCGNSEELIKKNAFETLFPKELIIFNKTLQQFIIKNN
ncbi:ABC transporter ATP-binding protein [Tenacibaculum piscium]|uniref:ABC transporter ATP-binding protein n=1 Tax=Tenacibaculum piscium TaxID=1458515 RepID=A0A2H1YFF4_9FLAO|nr:ABC transporter ATP-binding protein [Tenacibaculum piscium]MBE7628950.1 ATP-binding cassette domain-containing protein [Tenacibaculum piscium]MBE7671253.1 ATP-binding cassette domain-containing protein [Tenacibaculum piscium]SOS74111.1 ABC transporter ATP-binding protein [Tenacibaculum piscium]